MSLENADGVIHRSMLSAAGDVAVGGCFKAVDLSSQHLQTHTHHLRAPRRGKLLDSERQLASFTQLREMVTLVQFADGTGSGLPCRLCRFAGLARLPVGQPEADDGDQPGASGCAADPQGVGEGMIQPAMHPLLAPFVDQFPFVFVTLIQALRADNVVGLLTGLWESCIDSRSNRSMNATPPPSGPVATRRQRSRIARLAPPQPYARPDPPSGCRGSRRR